MSDDEIRALVSASGWRTAKSMPQWPHEYMIVGKTVPQSKNEDFQRFGKHIAEHGYVRYFYSAEIRYVDLDGRCYWHMGIDKNTGTYILINRADLPNIASKVKGRGPSVPPSQSAQMEMKSLFSKIDSRK